MTKTRLSAFVLCAALAACGGGSISVSDYGNSVINALCDHDVSCGLYSSHAACVAVYEQILNTDTLIADVNNGTAKYDGDKAKECLDAFGSASCDHSAMSYRVGPAACNDIVTGTVADGGVCKNSIECISDSCNVPTNCGMACCAGTCNPTAPPKAAIGAACPQGTACVDGAYCNAGTCAALIASGQPCTADNQCAYGTLCAGATGSQTCTAAPKAGDACLPHGTGTTCDTDGLICDATNHCAALVGSGKTCDPQVQNCVRDLQCDPTALTCGALPGNGQPCPNFECAPGNYCQFDAQFNPTTCAPLKDDNAACMQGGECKSGTCDTTSMTCTPRTVCS